MARLKHVSVCQLADGLGASCPVETAIRPLDPRFRICGPAVTVECPSGDNLTVHHALHMARHGEVLVVSSVDSNVALWGELMSISAGGKSLAGTIIDGPARDPLEICCLGYPVFCRSIHPVRPSKEMYGRINVPVRIGCLSIKPGDVLMADANGIACIQRTQLEQAIRLASEAQEKEKQISEQIRSGRTTFEIFDLEKYVPHNEQHSTKSE